VRHADGGHGGEREGAGPGSLILPDEWDGPDALGEGCACEGPPPVNTYDLVPTDPPPTPEEVSDVLERGSRNAVVAAFREAGAVTSAVLLLYGPSVGVFDPVGAEWIVLVNATHPP
jgi:hypothetical protein